MEFHYTKFGADDGKVEKPCVPITIQYSGKRFPIGNALVDTGADFTILPLEIAHVLEIELDDEEPARIACAGGGMFVALPSRKQLTFIIEQSGYRPIQWKGIAYFTEDEPLCLLGHYQCLDRFDLTFHGPEKTLDVLPCF